MRPGIAGRLDNPAAEDVEGIQTTIISKFLLTIICRYGHTIVTVAVVDIYSAFGISCCHRDRCRVRNRVHHTHHHQHQTER